MILYMHTVCIAAQESDQTPAQEQERTRTQTQDPQGMTERERAGPRRPRSLAYGPTTPDNLKRGDLSKRLVRLDGNRRRRAHHFRGSGLDAPIRVVSIDLRDQNNALPIRSAFENVRGDIVATPLAFALAQINHNLHSVRPTARPEFIRSCLEHELQVVITA